MNNGNGEFKDLKKLLTLKRHEQPPPRYFNDFSTRVLNRIEAGEPSGVMSRFWDRFPALERLRWTLAENPLSAAVFAVCGMLVVGFAGSQFFDGAGAGSANLAVVPGPFTTGAVAQNFQTDIRPEGIEILPPMVSPAMMQPVPTTTLLGGGFNIQPISYSVNE